MYKTRTFVLFSLIVLAGSASLERQAYEANIANYGLRGIHEVISPSNESQNLDHEDRSTSYESFTLDHESQIANKEPKSIGEETGNANDESISDLTAFGYHMKIGVPKAIELLKSEGLQARIVGGSQVARASVIPHQAGIIARLSTGWQSVCGGSLISNTRVLTAAHCWWDGETRATLFTIVLGSVTIFSGGTRMDTSAVTVHSGWNARDITNDIAMVKITRVTLNNNIRTIPLPSRTEVNLNFAGTSGIVSGFGKTSDAQTSSTTNLHQVSVSIITNAVCQTSLKTVALHSSHLCTSGSGRVGSCDGDSGGPLTTVHKKKKVLVGVVSFGLSDGCQVGSPSMYTRVTSFLTWINANMK